MGKLTVSVARELIAGGTPKRHGDGDGVWLTIEGKGKASALFRYTSPTTGKVRDFGLGRLNTELTAKDLQGIRDHAADARRLIRDGRDPIDERRASRPGPVIAVPKGPTFRQAADEFIAANRAGWRSAIHADQFVSSLTRYAHPTIGEKAIADITIDDVLGVLNPIWSVKPETGSRVRGRIERILDYATARGWRGPENVARWRGRLQVLLPAPRKLRPVVHHPAEPWRDMPALMRQIMAANGIGARCLAFAIFTAARSGEARLATWSEIDMTRKTWTVPGERMKAGTEHVVPLSAPALAILREMHPLRLYDDGTALIFPGMKPDKPLSDMSLSAVLRRLGRGDLTVHGFRSSFRDWCGDATEIPRDLAEAALAHSVGGVEGAYRRETAIERRRAMMAAWALFLLQTPAVKEKAARIHKRARK